MRIRKTREWLRAFGGFANLKPRDVYYDAYMRSFRGWLKTSGGRGNGLPPSLTPKTARLHARINRRQYLHACGEYDRHWNWYKRTRSRFDAKFALVVEIID